MVEELNKCLESLSNKIRLRIVHTVLRSRDGINSRTEEEFSDTVDTLDAAIRGGKRNYKTEVWLGFKAHQPLKVI